MRNIVISDAIIFTGDEFLENHALIIEGERISKIIPNNEIPSSIQKVSCAGKIIAPGFIDCQVNGGGNVLFGTATNIEEILKLVESHKKRGTTRLVLTLTSERKEVMKRALGMMRDARQRDSSILGIHFEGPHLNPERRGIHKIDFLRDITEEDFALYKPLPGETIILTLAPEKVSPDKIKRLCEQGTLVSLGHSAADVTRIKSALDSGATCFSHIFNGMGGIEARRPGLAGVALDDTNSWCSIIADGQHVADEVLRLAYRSKTRGKLFFISDAMPPAGAGIPKNFQIYGEIIHPEKGRCATSGGKLAGSSFVLSQCVEYAIKNVGIDPKEALRMASLYPADFLGLSHLFGKLLPGFTADIVVMDKNYSVTDVWFEGRKIN